MKVWALPLLMRQLVRNQFFPNVVGLLEVVEKGETGLVVERNNVESAFAGHEKLLCLIKNQ